MIKYTTKNIIKYIKKRCLQGIEFWTLYVRKMTSATTKSMAVCRDELHDRVLAPIPISTYFKISKSHLLKLNEKSYDRS
jgi:hypothetical protein